MSADIFGPGANPEKRICDTLEILSQRVEACRQLGLTIGATGGTFDLKHLGHELYMQYGKELCDVFVVGIDDDGKVKDRRGPQRPIVPEMERAQLLCHSRHVDLVYLKRKTDPHWAFIRAVRPDILLVSERTQYNATDLATLSEWCGKIVTVPSQAETSTTARIRQLHITLATQIKQLLAQLTVQIDELVGGA